MIAAAAWPRLLAGDLRADGRRRSRSFVWDERGDAGLRSRRNRLDQAIDLSRERRARGCGKASKATWQLLICSTP